MATGDKPTPRYGMMARHSDSGTLSTLDSNVKYSDAGDGPPR